MKPKKILKEILTDPKHWFGWALSTISVISVFYFFDYFNGVLPLTHWLTIFGTIVLVDSFKHIWKLQ